MKEELKVEHDLTTRTLYINGIPYVSKKIVKEKVDGVTHLRTSVYGKATKKEIDESINKIVKKIKGNVSKEELLKQLVRNKMSMRLITKVNKNIGTKEVKKHTGCLGFKVGKDYIQLID